MRAQLVAAAIAILTAGGCAASQPSAPPIKPLGGITVRPLLRAADGGLWVEVADTGASSRVATGVFRVPPTGGAWSLRLRLPGKSVDWARVYAGGAAVLAARSQPLAGPPTLQLFRSPSPDSDWQQMAMPSIEGFPLTFASFPDPQHGWILASAAVSLGSSAQPGRLFRTADGGDTWSIAAEAATAPGGLPLDAGGTRGGLTFVTDSVGWIPLQDTRGFIGLLVSTDAGSTWSEVTLPDPGGREGALLSVRAPVDLGDGSLAAPAYSRTAAIGGHVDQEYVIVSTPGADAVARVVGLSPTLVDPAGGAWPVFESRDRWSVLIDGVLSVTSDGGGHWSKLVPTLEGAGTGPLLRSYLGVEPGVAFGSFDVGPTIDGRMSTRLAVQETPTLWHAYGATPSAIDPTWHLPFHGPMKISKGPGVGSHDAGDDESIDFVPQAGSRLEVYALAAGTVVWSAGTAANVPLDRAGVCTAPPTEGNQYGYGNLVIVRSGSPPLATYAYYAHLSTRTVEVGDTVARDSIVGVIGNAGCSSGSHLHFAVRADVDPGDLVRSGSGVPLRELPGIDWATASADGEW